MTLLKLTRCYISGLDNDVLSCVPIYACYQKNIPASLAVILCNSRLRAYIVFETPKRCNIIDRTMSFLLSHYMSVI